MSEQRRSLTLCSQCKFNEGDECDPKCKFSDTICPQVDDNCGRFEAVGTKTPCGECSYCQRGKVQCEPPHEVMIKTGRRRWYQFEPRWTCPTYKESGKYASGEYKSAGGSMAVDREEFDTEEEGGLIKKKNPFKGIKVGVEFAGKKMVLPAEPARMPLRQAIDTLQAQLEEDETAVEVVEPIEAFPWDGAYCFFMAMSDMFGWGQAVKSPPKGFFDPGSEPRVITIDVGFEERAEIIWGNFKIPGIEGELACETSRKDGRQIFCLGGWVRRKHHPEVKALAELTRQYVKQRSIYRGKAFRIFSDENRDVDYGRPPEFINTRTVNLKDLVFNRNLEEQIETNIFTPVRHTHACRANNIPLSRGILLEGPFGTGKTLTATAAAQTCEDNDWTFIIVDNVVALRAALDFARLYQPVMVFAEDIDRAMSGERNTSMDTILNTIDGVAGKGVEVITILTTNNVEGINPAMLRPGRLDAVISLRAPDEEAVQRLIRVYSRQLLDPEEDLREVGRALKGQIPATIREVVERSKLYAIKRSGSANISLTGKDLTSAAEGMVEHLELLNRPRDKAKSPEEELGASMLKIVAKANNGSGEAAAAEKKAAEKKAAAKRISL